jgi:hypothetical protein
MTAPTTDTTPTAAHFRRISSRDLAAMWADRSITRAQIAATVGLSERAVTMRVKAMGLPLRGRDTKRPSITDKALFADLWWCGVGSSEIAAHFGVGPRTVANTRDRLGLPNRHPGKRPAMTLAAFFIARREIALAKAMAKTAELEQAQFRLAEMWDRNDRSYNAGRKLKVAG